MKILLYCILIVLTIFPVTTFSQEENWDVYVSRYEKGVGSTMLNMDLYRMAPVKNFSFVLITGVKFKDCTGDGMPSKREFENLYSISDTIKKRVAKATLNIPTGTFTYQCERLDYFYVNDTGKLRQTLLELYKTQFPSYKPYISIKPDKGWDAYFKFLYPNDEAKEYMSNQKLVTKLYNAGDKLEKERPVAHWLYFSTESDRKCFISYAVSKGFKIIAKEKIDRTTSPLKLQISRSESMQLASITKTTLELKKQAKRCNGDYDAWETFAIKDE
jgi:Family of unknown function (DUF695)/Regulator of ribonuclease activity B